MRICILKATGKLLEMQSDATEGTLIQNAVNAGFAAADIEERVVTPEQYAILIPQTKRRVPKSLIIKRLNDAGMLARVKTALDANLYARERWYAPDRPSVDADDPEAVALLKAAGADPNVILAP